tara:strand:- start:119 stop:1273 length:1155 start_codon:yes stop_codon:yes gene_type:complete
MTTTVESAVRERYSEAAKAPEAALCCPVEYNPQYLKIIPEEIIAKDYGCGDPSQHVREGEVVVDLGSGGGKSCYIASQIVGVEGKVIGVDMNDEMLALARKYQPEIITEIGHDNVEFRKGRIQDLRLDRDLLDAWLQDNPVTDELSLRRMEETVARFKQEQPLVADDSVDVVTSNCVLNLVSDGEKKELFDEVFRVLRRGGRAAISDIVADEPVPQELKDDPELWSGCVSGAMQEEEFLKAFEAAGFYGIEMTKRDVEPWRVVGGIEFRSVTVVAYKGKEGACWDHNEALIYRGPFKSVSDDDGHTFVRGQRVAVCRKTREIFSRSPYSDYFEVVEPLNAVTEPEPFPCDSGTLLRHPRQTKGEDYALTTEAGACCAPEDGVCC